MNIKEELNDDELLTCLSVNVYDPEFHRKLWFGSSNVRRQEVLTLDLQAWDPLVV